MSVLNQSGEEQVECPLCMEPLEVDDLNFYPCTCGYQICRFCWHRIRTDENGLCPACRKAYSENPADFTPLSKEQVAQLKAEKRARDQQRKARLSESRKHLASVRVVQRNLVFVVGLPMRLADAEILRRHEYFGKFGRIHKVVINQSTSYAGSQGPSASAYVTYYKSDDALRAIQSVNNIILDGRLIKSSLGTTKYCSHFMKNQLCPKADCMYLHDLGDSEASFTKEEMHQGKHQEYERRLHEQLATQSSLKTQSGATQTCQNGTTIQKEAWPSLSRNGSPPNVGKERKLSASETKQTSQTSKSSSNSEISDVPANNKSNTEVVSSQPLPQSKSEKSQKSKNSKTKHNNSNNNTSSVQNNNFDNNSNNNVNSSNAKNSRKVQDSQKLQTNRTNATNGPVNIVQNGSDTDSVSETSQTERRTSDIEPSKRKAVETSEDSRTALSGEKCNRSGGEIENPTNSESDRSTDSSPLAQNLSKISLYEDNTSFFSPNTFQKLISDKDGSSNFTETNTMTQASSILNDNLPNISSSEDWEAAFGFSNGKTIFSSNSLENSPGSSSSTVSVPNRNIVAGMSQDVVHGTQAAYGGIGGQFGAENVRLVDGQREISVGPLGNRNSIYVSTPNVAENDVDAIHATAGPNQVFVSENDGPVGGDAARGSVYDGLASVGVPPRSLADAANNMLMNSNIDMKSTIVAETMPSIINGLDQNMYKFFSDFHKNSTTVMKDAHDYLPNGFTEHVPNVFNPADVGRQNTGGSVGNGRQLPDHMLAGSNGQQNQQNSLMNPQQNMLYQQQQQRLMEKQLSEQLLSMKTHHSQNGTQSPHGLLSASNQQTFINQHGGYQQNFLLQNQINLVQNQHNLVGGDQHNLNLLGSQQNLAQSIIGSALNGQHSLLGGQSIGTGGNGRSLIADHMNVQPTHNLHNLIGAAVTQQNSYGFPTQSRAHLAGMIGATNQQRGVDDDLGFDPFHETQKGFAELMESEQVLNNQAQHRTRLPPPGFSHMNAFGIGLPRPHGSKILPFMGLGQGNNTQQPVVSSQQQSTNAWHLPNPQQITSSHKGLGVCNDWTSLDPAIVTSSRHFQFANVGPIRDQFAGVHGIGGPIRNIDFTNGQQQTFSQPQQNGYQTATPNGFSSVQFANQQQQQQQQQQNSGQFGSLVNGFSSGNHNWLSAGTEYQNQIPMPPGFRQSNSQGKTQEC